MSTKTENKTETTTRRKISVKQVKLSDMETGFKFGGKFVGFVQGQPFQTVDQKTGEILTKCIPSAIFEHNQERTAYLADKGLQDAIANAMVEVGHTVEIVKLDKVKLNKGRTMNQYDIFAV